MVDFSAIVARTNAKREQRNRVIAQGERPLRMSRDNHGPVEVALHSDGWHAVGYTIEGDVFGMIGPSAFGVAVTNAVSIGGDPFSVVDIVVL